MLVERARCKRFCLRSVQTAFRQTSIRLTGEGVEMKTLKTEDLDQFTGSDHYYRHPVVQKIMWTDGVQYVAISGECLWLLDEIVFAQSLPRVKKEEFQAWRLQVKDSVGVLTCEDGNNHRVFRKVISWTDFPLPEIRLWLTDNVIMLPSEY